MQAFATYMASYTNHIEIKYYLNLKSHLGLSDRT